MSFEPRSDTTWNKVAASLSLAVRHTSQSSGGGETAMRRLPEEGG